MYLSEYRSIMGNSSVKEYHHNRHIYAESSSSESTSEDIQQSNDTLNDINTTVENTDSYSTLFQEEKDNHTTIAGMNIQRIRTEKADVQLEKTNKDAEEELAHSNLTIKPWRKFESGGGWITEENGRMDLKHFPDDQKHWTYLHKLVDGIRELEHEGNIKYARIVLFGLGRSGKSSFMNSVASIDTGRISSYVTVGEGPNSLTRNLHQFKPRNISTNFVIMDTMGMHDKNLGLNMTDIELLMKGKIPLNHTFSHSRPYTAVRDASMEETAQCIVIVVSAPNIDADSLPQATLEKFQALMEFAHENNIGIVLLLTKIDQLCDEIEEDITTVYRSRKMHKVVKNASEMFGVPEMYIFPIKNYSKEPEMDPNMNLLVLLALRQMVRCANDRIQRMVNQEIPSI